MKIGATISDINLWSIKVETAPLPTNEIVIYLDLLRNACNPNVICRAYGFWISALNKADNFKRGKRAGFVLILRKEQVEEADWNK